MEKDMKQILIDFLDVIREHPSIQIFAPTQVVVDWHEKEINCLEAKPKALHSMKCDEKVCCYELSDEEFLNTKVSDTCKCNKDECKHEGTRPSRGH
ncbi:hypothetical protein [Roseivirga spongicola]|nr:hypothetical protein [Roseivirga spongicola]WPZ08714.1 hypothetical protein T7867_10640 [Roseivirga spongicola]